MFPPNPNDCDECTLKTPAGRLSTLAFASLPFLLTFFIVATVVSHRLFPLLSGQTRKAQNDGHVSTANYSLPATSTFLHRLHISGRNIASATFSANIALSTVLVELILCEISGSINPAARGLAFRTTIFCLLVLLILVAPALELHSIIRTAGWNFRNGGQTHTRIAWLLEAAGLALWFAAFWYVGEGILGNYLKEKSYIRSGRSFTESCLERIGIIGISLMASLAGFAAVSSVWHTFGLRTRLVSESLITRKQAGLDATDDMLALKQSRLRALERKMSEPMNEGFLTRTINAVRGNADSQERNALRLEISGLETMRMSLSNSLVSLQSQRQSQLRAHTALGKFLNACAYCFSIYCLYRLGATAFTTFRRFYNPDTSFSSTDPINNFLALFAKHVDPKLDRESWARQISFLLSGVMLLASFNSVVQTCLLFGRLFPSALQHAQANLALLVSQVSATYVISSALLLRSNLPVNVSSVISEALGAPLESAFVEKWFEGWFLVTAAFTVIGIWLGKKIRGAGWEDDDDITEMGNMEMGKMN
jgi:hypothetical protein